MQHFAGMPSYSNVGAKLVYMFDFGGCLERDGVLRTGGELQSKFASSDRCTHVSSGFGAATRSRGPKDVRHAFVWDGFRILGSPDTLDRQRMYQERVEDGVLHVFSESPCGLCQWIQHDVLGAANFFF